MISWKVKFNRELYLKMRRQLNYIDVTLSKVIWLSTEYQKYNFVKVTKISYANKVFIFLLHTQFIKNDEIQTSCIWKHEC